MADALLDLVMREPDRDRERAERRRRAQQAEAPRAGHQHVLGVDRQQRGDAAEQHGEQVERDRAEHHLVVADVAKAREHRLDRDRLLLRRRALQPDQADQDARQHEHRRAGQIDRARAEHIEQAADRRPADDGGLARGRRRRDRALQQVRRHDPGHQRVHGRRLEGARRAADEQDRQHHVAASESRRACRARRRPPPAP